MPKPRLRYYGVFAPNAPLRKAVTAQADMAVDATIPTAQKSADEMESRQNHGARFLWAALLFTWM